MHKYLFLDIDGVICTSFKERQNYTLDRYCFVNFKDSYHWEEYYILNPLCIDYLNKIVKETNCKIVISSSWRKVFSVKGLQTVFEKNDFHYPKNIIGVTPRGYDFVIKGSHCPIPRGSEIKIWLDLNVRKVKEGFRFEDYTYAILDDDPDMLLAQKDNYFQTDFNMGLTEKISKQVIMTLNKKK